MIRNIVFDVGDVLVDFCYKDYMRGLGFDEELVELFSKEIVLTEFWHEMDLGIKFIDDGRELFTKRFPQYKDEITRFWDNIKGIVKEYDYAKPLIHKLKEQGYGVYILSNYPIETTEMHWPTFTFLEETDGRVISGYEKITKPDEGIYRLLESRFGIKLEECIFIDDRQINIDAANKYGMTAILFKGYDELREQLSKYDINI